MAFRQVLERALGALGLATIPLNSPDAVGVAQDPARQDAFICNLQVRPVPGSYAHVVQTWLRRP